jgi:hypothetical protein
MSRVTRSLIVLVVALLVPLTAVMPVLAEDATIQAPAGSWLAQYWNNTNYSGPPVVQRIESNVSHNWGGGSPAPGIPVDNFAARWTGTFNLSGGEYILRTRTDDGVRVWVDGALKINDWNLHSLKENTARVNLSAGTHTFVVDYFEWQGDAIVFFEWEAVGAPPPPSGQDVEISPTSGPPGTVVQVHGWGFGRYAQVTVGIAPSGGAAVGVHTVTANQNGEFWTTVSLPGWAHVGQHWYVTAASNGQTAFSPPFVVTSGGPPPPAPPPPGHCPCGPTYVVRYGDWMSRIARKCQVNYWALLRANQHVSNPNRIWPGMVLNIPDCSVQPPPAPARVTGTLRANLNHRTRPYIGAPIIRVIPYGTTLTLQARTASGWFLVSYGGRTGWIAGWYVRVHGDLGDIPLR